MTSFREHIESLGRKDHLQLDRLALRCLHLHSNYSNLSAELNFYKDQGGECILDNAVREDADWRKKKSRLTRRSNKIN